MDDEIKEQFIGLMEVSVQLEEVQKDLSDRIDKLRDYLYEQGIDATIPGLKGE